MALIKRRAEDRGRTATDWLDSRHSFSFGSYYDPNSMGFGPLRVVNDDRVAAGGGFGTHGHKDMEILTYVVDGELRHRDSLGAERSLGAGEMQSMSAGTGIRHSEFNASASEPVRFLQIWIEPEERGLAPRYDQKRFDVAEQAADWTLVASGDGRLGSLPIRRDVDLYAAAPKPGRPLTHEIGAGRLGWIQVVRGAIEVDGVGLREGDGAELRESGPIVVTNAVDAEVLLFDMSAKGAH